MLLKRYKLIFCSLSRKYFQSDFDHFENVLGIENEISVFNVLTTFRYYFSKYEASDNLIPYQINSPTKYI